MAFFPFPAPGRRKMAPPPPMMAPMSKAHRILGSMPLSIDAPPSNRDDASSSAFSDDTTATSYGPDSDAGDFFDDHPVGIAKSDNGWGDESGVLPISLRLDHHLGDGPDDLPASITPSILRKSRSSSTIKSWYDKSKLPLAISQQTSSSAMAKGLPTKPNGMLDINLPNLSALEVPTTRESKKKPARLDLSSLMPGPRLIRRVSRRHLGGGGEPGLALDSTATSPAVDSSPACQLAPPLFPIPRPEATRRRGSNQWPRTSEALSALPTLYDHYEQMSMRHVMKQCSQPDMSRPEAGLEPSPSFSRTEWQLARRTSKCFDWVHDSLPPTPQTAFQNHAKTFPRPATSTQSVSSRLTKTSKTMDRSFGSADLQRTSVLVLSESEGDDILGDISPRCKRNNAACARRSSLHENDMPRHVTSRTRRPTGSGELPSRTAKSSRRASFAAASTCVTIPEAKGGSGLWPQCNSSQPTTLLSSVNNASAATDSSSRRASIASNLSASSAATEQSKKSVYSIREARAVTMLPARRPSSPEEHGAEKVRWRTSDWNGSLRRQSVSSSTDQLTPPLSPTSVDFYIHSARSSIDGSGSHCRLMAVSRQEELLLSALRQKQKSTRGSVLIDLREAEDGQVLGESACRRPSATKATHHAQRRGSRDQRPKAPRTSSAELTMIDLDLRAPRRLKSDASNSVGRHSTNGTLSRRWSAAAAVSGNGMKRSSRRSRVDEDVPLMLDDADPSPDLSDYRDWHAAMTAGTTPAGKPSSRRDLFGSQSRCHRRGSTQSSSGCSPTRLRPESPDRLFGVAEETPGDVEMEVDVPRPDSPISPESFPAVPDGREAGGNLTRLSAVGSDFAAGGVTRPQSLPEEGPLGKETI